MRLALIAIVLLISSVAPAASVEADDLRVGIIGLDTSHSSAFTKIIYEANTSNEGAVPTLKGCRVVAAYPQGSRDIPSSLKFVPDVTEKVQAYGVEIVASIEELLTRVDAVLLESNDGRVHLEQVVPVLKARKRVFVDKPVAGSLADVIAIYMAANFYDTPVFSSSSLRYTDGAKAINGGSIGDVIGCDAYSPCPIELTHPDFFWYGIHGVETMYSVLGPGCESVVRVSTDNTDVAVGRWSDGRIGTFRGRRKPGNAYQSGYGGTAFGTTGVAQIGGFSGYEPLLIEVVEFFRTGQSPVEAGETIEIYTFMAAADESKRLGGVPVLLADVRAKAETLAMQRLKEFGLTPTAEAQ